MKKFAALLLSLMFLLSCFGATAQEALTITEDTSDGLLLQTLSGLDPAYSVEYYDGQNFIYRVEEEAIGTKESKVLLADASGAVIPGKEFTVLGAFSGDLAPALKFAGGTYGYIDREGNYAIPPIFSMAWEFQEGLAPVELDGRQAFIDRSGQVVHFIDSGWADSFSDGYAWVRETEADTTRTTHTLLNNRFETVGTTQDYTYISPYQNGVACAVRQVEGGTYETDLLDTSLAVSGTLEGWISPVLITEDKEIFYYGTGSICKATADGQTQVLEGRVSTAASLGGGIFAMETEEGVDVADGALEVIKSYPGAGIYNLIQSDRVQLRMEDGSVGFLSNPDYQPPQAQELTYEYLPLPEEEDKILIQLGSGRMEVNGEMVLLDADHPSVTAITINGRTMLPVRAMSGFFGYGVFWNEDTQQIGISGEKEIILQLDSTLVILSEYDQEAKGYLTEYREDGLDAAPTLVDGVTYVPVRFFAECIGKQVYWDERGLVALCSQEEDFEKNADEYLARFDGAMLSYDQYPVIDGSTATIPLSVALTARALGISQEQAQRITNHTKTSSSFERLIGGEADLILSGAPGDERNAMAAEKGVELEYFCFAKEAFVFMVNGQNPVDGLTTKQIQDIYQGKITNWSEVGGNDAAIIPYQRNETSGSQGIMEREVMQGLEMMDPKTLQINAMGEIVDVVAEFDNAQDAIGYSVYYYFSEMHNRQEVKLLSVDGVAPSDENIRSGSYPFIIDYCVVIRKDTPQGSPARMLFDFLQTQEGQQLVADTGFVSAQSIGEEQESQEEVSQEEASFTFSSARWGDTWESLKTREPFSTAAAEEIGGDANRIKLSGFSYLGATVDVGLLFDTEESKTPGLCTVAVHYQEEDEDALLQQLTALYGERKDHYLDKNGVENPLQPAGWVSQETVEGTLTDEEKEIYLGWAGDIEQTRLDAMLRSPLVSIRFDEDRNNITFSAANAALVRYLQEISGDGSEASGQGDLMPPFSSIHWGDDWETVQNAPEFRGATAEVIPSAASHINLSDFSYLGTTVDLLLAFGTGEDEPWGLYSIGVLYQDEDEEALMQQLTALYGEPRKEQSSNILSANWASEKTVGEALSQEERETLMSWPEAEPAQMEEVLQTPLVTIQVNKTMDTISFFAYGAALVRYLQEISG